MARLNLINSLILILTPIAAAAGLAYWVPEHGIHGSDLACLGLFYVATGLSITMGYHRYYAHRSFECHPAVQFLMLFFGATALQYSVLRWASDHRNHHAHEGTDRDPYNIRRGFFWAHMGWILLDSGDFRPGNVKDLARMPMVLWQNQYYVPIVLAGNLLLPWLFGLAFDRPWEGLFWGGLVRLVAVHHVTFLINSAAHRVGTRRHLNETTAGDSALLGLLAFGEGYHNFHHANPRDYRNGPGRWDLDATKWTIRALSWLRLTWKLHHQS